AALAAKRVTETIPIVVPAAGNPAGTGLVRPGGNVAAFDVLPPEAVLKQLTMLREVVIGLRRIAVVWNASNPSSQLTAKRVREVADTHGVELTLVEVTDPGQLDARLAEVKPRGAQAILLVADPQFLAQRQRIGQLTTPTGLDLPPDFGHSG